MLPVDRGALSGFRGCGGEPQFLGWVAGLGGGLDPCRRSHLVQKMQALVQRLVGSTVRRMGTRHS